VINSGGIKLHPEQIEKKLSKIIDQRLFVIGMPDDALGEKLVLFVENEFSEDFLQKLEKEINQLKSLEKYERPKKIYFIEKFEETHTGKIHRENTFTSKVN
jgi:O-succinylbenzoic acid--CoA ligase